MATLNKLREQLAQGDQDSISPDEDEGDDFTQVNKEKKNKEDEKDKAPQRLRRMLQFRQYMRSDNVEDRELMEDFLNIITDIDDWDREDHLDDLRPSVWFRQGDHVAEVYTSLGVISATFGYLPKKDGEDQDYTMMESIFPPVILPYEVEDEDTGEKEESFDNAFEKLSEFLSECSDYIKQTGQSDDNDKPGKSRKSYDSGNYKTVSREEGN